MRLQSLKAPLLHALVLGSLVLWVLPLFALLVSPFRPQANTAASGWWVDFLLPVLTWENYALALDKTHFGKGLANSLVIALPSTLSAVLPFTFGALALVRMDFAGRAAMSLVLGALLVTPPHDTLAQSPKLYHLVWLSPPGRGSGFTKSPSPCPSASSSCAASSPPSRANWSKSPCWTRR